MNSNDRENRNVARMRKSTRSTWWLEMFAAGNIKPSEAQLDAHIDVLVELLERVNDARFPDALDQELPEDG